MSNSDLIVFIPMHSIKWLSVPLSLHEPHNNLEPGLQCPLFLGIRSVPGCLLCMGNFHTGLFILCHQSKISTILKFTVHIPYSPAVRTEYYLSSISGPIS